MKQVQILIELQFEEMKQDPNIHVVEDGKMVPWPKQPSPERSLVIVVDASIMQFSPQVEHIVGPMSTTYQALLSDGRRFFRQGELDSSGLEKLETAGFEIIDPERGRQIFRELFERARPH